MKFSPVPPVLVEQGICNQKGGPDFFSSDPCEVRRAKNMCAPCPVRFQCIQYATRPESPETYGVWGGADQWELRIACAVDPSGDPVKRARRAKCPFCRSAKNVTEVREIRTRASQAHCSECGLTWRRARSFVKKERVSRQEVAAIIPFPRPDDEVLVPDEVA
jgi:WhiB family redox-sensing transcriptional regulator